MYNDDEFEPSTYTKQIYYAPLTYVVMMDSGAGFCIYTIFKYL